MANYIPKIQYANINTGVTTVNGSGNISGIGDAQDLIPGMLVTGTGIQAGTTLVSVNADLSTAVLSLPATANGSGVSLDFYFEIDFTYPPEGMPTENSTPNRNVSYSLSGIAQTVLNYTEVTFNATFSALPQSIVDSLQTFYDNHAVYGKEFYYFENSDVNFYQTYTYGTSGGNDDFSPTRTSWDGSQWLYSVTMYFRRPSK